MRKLTAQFKIKDELLTANGELYNNDEITEMVVQRLRNRSAEFDKIVEDDGDDDIQIQLHDQDLDEAGSKTLVNVTIEINDDAVAILESDPDLVFSKAIAEIDSGKLKLVADETQQNISHLSFA